MSVQLTPAGEQAYQAVQWAFDSPTPRRVQQAQDRIAQLVSENSGGKPAQEIGDAATMLSRLAGSLKAPARTISSQVG